MRRNKFPNHKQRHFRSISNVIPAPSATSFPPHQQRHSREGGNPSFYASSFRLFQQYAEEMGFPPARE
jgi:hypothetical protein